MITTTISLITKTKKYTNMKKILIALSVLLVIPFFSIVFGYLSCEDCRETAETSNEKMDIYFNDGEKIRLFKIKHGYVEHLHASKIRDYLILVVGYPEMSPMARSNALTKNEIRILITQSTKRTIGEFKIATRNESKNPPDIGSRTELYIGMDDGYEIYESAPNPKTIKKIKTRVFYDEDNNIVSDDGDSGSARMLSGLVVQYDASATHGADPRTMHKWVKSFLENNLNTN